MRICRTYIVTEHEPDTDQHLTLTVIKESVELIKWHNTVKGEKK